MNKPVIFSLCCLLSIKAVLGHEQKDIGLKQPYNIDSAPFLAAGHEDTKSHEYGCSGNLRVGYIQSSIGLNSTLSANALGGELGCSYSFDKYINVTFGLFASIDTGLNHDDDINIQDDFFNRKKDSYIVLGEAVLTLNYDRFEAHLGRQRLDSPHMDGDDLRMIPNLFEAYLLDYRFSDQFFAGAGFVREVSGWENGSDRSHFVGVGDAFGGNGGASLVSWVSYEQDQLSSNIWYYLIPDHMLIVYAELSYSGQINQTYSYSLGLQYDWGTDAGAARLGSVQAHAWGVLATFSGYDITAGFAYNRNHSENGAIPSLGGGPFFTSMEDQTLDAVSGEDASAILFSLEYYPVDFVTIGSAFGKFRANDKRLYDREETNLYLAVYWKELIALEVMYANLDDKNTLESDHQFRVIMTYHF